VLSLNRTTAVPAATRVIVNAVPPPVPAGATVATVTSELTAVYWPHPFEIVTVAVGVSAAIVTVLGVATIAAAVLDTLTVTLDDGVTRS